MGNYKLETNPLHYIHFYLLRLLQYEPRSFGIEESLIEDCDFLELIRGNWKENSVSMVSIQLLREFRKKWVEYKQENSYSIFSEFMFIDKKWESICKNYLIPAIESLEKDLTAMNIEFIPFKSIPERKPTEEELLKLAKHISNLLIEKRILERHYMDE